MHGDARRERFVAAHLRDAAGRIDGRIGEFDERELHLALRVGVGGAAAHHLYVDAGRVEVDGAGGEFGVGAVDLFGGEHGEHS